MAVANTLAYYNMTTIIDVISSIVQAPGECNIKPFTVVINSVSYRASGLAALPANIRLG
jgi:hypothetical protein